MPVIVVNGERQISQTVVVNFGKEEEEVLDLPSSLQSLPIAMRFGYCCNEEIVEENRDKQLHICMWVFSFTTAEKINRKTIGTSYSQHAMFP